MSSTPEEKADIEKFNKYRTICLENAQDLLKGAQLLIDGGIDHAAYHLSVLALEEIGKVHVAALSLMARQNPKPTGEIPNFDTDDHEKKIFYAIWGPSFGRKKMTAEDFKQNKEFGKDIHERRLNYLYSDADNLVGWKEKIREGEAKAFHDLVTVRLSYENAVGEMSTEELPAEEKAELTWFLEASQDPMSRREIWGHQSQDKLIEFGGDVKKWIRWLKDLYDKNKAQMMDFVKDEMKPKTLAEQEMTTPKWRVKVRVVTPSHTIKASELSKLNKLSTNLKLNRIDSSSCYLVITHPKSVPALALWDLGWGMARMFIVAMNIGTMGFFWWNIKTDPARYYEEIWDLEKNAGVRIEPSLSLEMDWQKKKVLDETDIMRIFVVFNYLTYEWQSRPGTPHFFDDYAMGLAALAKNDVHLRLDISAFEMFFKALKGAMLKHGHWDGQSDLMESFSKLNLYTFSDLPPEIQKCFRLGVQIEATHSASEPMTVGDLYTMKSLCDAYFLRLVKEFGAKNPGGVKPANTDSSEHPSPKKE